MNLFSVRAVKVEDIAESGLSAGGAAPVGLARPTLRRRLAAIASRHTTEAWRLQGPPAGPPDAAALRPCARHSQEEERRVAHRSLSGDLAGPAGRGPAGHARPCAAAPGLRTLQGCSGRVP